jgi:hypothetical protein
MWPRIPPKNAALASDASRTAARLVNELRDMRSPPFVRVEGSSGRGSSPLPPHAGAAGTTGVAQASSATVRPGEALFRSGARL